MRTAIRLAIMPALLLTMSAQAQQKVPFANGVPVAPTGLADQVLPAGPFDMRTGEGQDIRVTVLARDIEYPYSLAFLPNGDLLFTERTGRLRVLRGGKLDPNPITGGPVSKYAGKSGGLGAVHGYMSLIVHRNFAQNQLIYFAYSKPLDATRHTVAVARARLVGNALQDVRDIFVGENLRGAVSLAMTPDNLLWIATGADAAAQDPMSLGGKVMRLKDDGTVPADNPFVGKAGYRPEIYTMGHRSSMGLAVHPVSGAVYLSEMGPNGGDEINLLKPGRNYGWPLVSLGRTYPGPWQAKVSEPTHAGFEPPLLYWMPAISVSGLTFYTGDALPKWKGDLFVGGVRYGEVPGTGRLDRILLNDRLEELRRESLLGELHQRIRDVKQGPDGMLYVATDEPKGAILRISPGAR
ncbi:MAG: PQQ-dependent sugar dehydrogenase [Proteobacteria bacterium]|nr:PQQ-dependent sugar dehydrogenase [Pseudomonadota bacterium]MBK9252716.1 PQQ-dependent sugar dehydrogenase [Pseudomonadota bacterium]